MSPVRGYFPGLSRLLGLSRPRGRSPTPPPLSRGFCHPRWRSRGAGLGSSTRSPADSRCRCPLCAFYTKTPPWEGPRTKRVGLLARPRASGPYPRAPGELPTERGFGGSALPGPGRAPRCGEARPGRPRDSPGPGPGPPAAAASIINGGSGVQRLPPRETLPGAAGASLLAPRERWMRRRFPVTAMPGGGAGGAAAVPPLPLLQ